MYQTFRVVFKVIAMTILVMICFGVGVGML